MIRKDQTGLMVHSPRWLETKARRPLLLVLQMTWSICRGPGHHRTEKQRQQAGKQPEEWGGGCTWVLSQGTWGAVPQMNWGQVLLWGCAIWEGTGWGQPLPHDTHRWEQCGEAPGDIIPGLKTLKEGEIIKKGQTWRESASVGRTAHDTKGIYFSLTGKSSGLTVPHLHRWGLRCPERRRSQARAEAHKRNIVSCDLSFSLKLFYALYQGQSENIEKK